MVQDIVSDTVVMKHIQKNIAAFALGACVLASLFGESAELCLLDHEILETAKSLVTHSESGLSSAYTALIGERFGPISFRLWPMGIEKCSTPWA